MVHVNPERHTTRYVGRSGLGVRAGSEESRLETAVRLDDDNPFWPDLRFGNGPVSLSGHVAGCRYRSCSLLT